VICQSVLYHSVCIVVLGFLVYLLGQLPLASCTDDDNSGK